MPPVTQDLKLIVSQEGIPQTSAAMKGLQGEIDKTTKSTSTLTKFVREQRQEQRLQTFLFRESAGVVLLFSNALGETSRSAKELKNSINAGFATFQGLNFLLASVNPALGLTIAAIGGMAAAWTQFGQGQEAPQIMDSYIEKLILIGKMSKESAIDVARLTKSELELQLAQLQSVVTTNARVPTGRMIFNPSSRSVVEEMIDQQMTSQAGTSEEIRAKQEQIADQDIKILNFNKQITDEKKKQADELDKFYEGLEKERKKWDEVEIILTKIATHLKPNNRDKAFDESGRLRKQDLVPTPEFRPDHSNLIEEVKQDYFILFDSVNALGGTLRNSLGGAFEDVFGEANSLLEQFAQRLFEILAMRAAGSLLSLIPVVGPLLAAGFGGGFSPVSGGGELERKLSNPTFQRALTRTQSNRARLDKAT